MRRIVTAGILLVLSLAGVWSVQLSRADAAVREGTDEGIARAIELAPGNAAYLAMRGLQQEAAGLDATESFERVAQLNPTLAGPRLRLGLTAERQGDATTAERWLLEANAVDKQFEPRWTLANFYLRQGKREEFWKWIRAAAAVSYGERDELFDLCWRASADPAEILRVIPEAGPVREAYLLYVVSRPRVEAIAAAARGVQDERLLLVATDVLIEAGRYADAVEVWRELGHAAPEGVTSPRFDGEASGRGFDWRFINSDGVTHQQLEQGRGHRVRLSGTQGEQAALLSQYVGGLKKGTRYRLRVEVDGAPEGLQWRLAGEPVTNEFTAKSEVALLQLWYERPRGAVRAEADFDLKEVTVSALQ